MEENRNTEPLASEMYKDLQKHDAFKMKVIKWLVVALVFSIVGNVGQSIYHDWKWSMFYTYVVDSGDGSGNANLVQGDVGGDRKPAAQAPCFSYGVSCDIATFH